MKAIIFNRIMAILLGIASIAVLICAILDVIAGDYQMATFWLLVLILTDRGCDSMTVRTDRLEDSTDDRL